MCGNFFRVKQDDEDILYGNLKPEHGYAKKNRIFNDLMKFMCKLG